MGRTYITNARLYAMQENHIGQAGGQWASGKAKYQMHGRSNEGCREAGS